MTRDANIPAGSDTTGSDTTGRSHTPLSQATPRHLWDPTALFHRQTVSIDDAMAD